MSQFTAKFETKKIRKGTKLSKRLNTVRKLESKRTMAQPLTNLWNDAQDSILSVMSYRKNRAIQFNSINQTMLWNDNIIHFTYAIESNPVVWERKEASRKYFDMLSTCAYNSTRDYVTKTQLYHNLKTQYQIWALTYDQMSHVRKTYA